MHRAAYIAPLKKSRGELAMFRGMNWGTGEQVIHVKKGGKRRFSRCSLREGLAKSRWKSTQERLCRFRPIVPGGKVPDKGL